MRLNRFIATVFGTLLASSLIAPGAFASTMPKMDFTRNNFGIGLGNGVNLSLDFPMGSSWSLGVGAGIPGFNTTNVDVRALWRFYGQPASGLDMGLLLGVGFGGSGVGQFGNYNGELGLGFAYPFTDRLTGRLNLVGSYGNAGVGALPSGVEIGYQFAPSVEGTLGYDGRGDILGLNWTF